MGDQLQLTIEAKLLGQRKSFVENWSVNLPRSPRAAGDGLWRLTLRELLTLIVTDEVAGFHQRQQERRLARVMAPTEIAQGATAGKIDMGGREPQVVCSDEAVAAALQAFADRLYLVLLDGAPVETLERELALHEESRLTFVRLVALVGG